MNITFMVSNNIFIFLWINIFRQAYNFSYITYLLSVKFGDEYITSDEEIPIYLALWLT